MVKKQAKLGVIRFNDSQKEMIAKFVESDMFKLLKSKYRMFRQERIGQLAVRLAQDEKELWYYKGMLAESDEMFTTLESVASGWVKANGDPDSDDPDAD
jgi:hypothetical protein